ncbi:MAG TPA: hypothetical protein VGL59_18935 [Polyangia bacterium]|jgi:hypothetical protein
MADGDDPVEMIAAEITRYLTGRPDAGDTVEGISRFWLKGRHHDQPTEQIQEALDRLVQRKVVRRTILPDGKPLYQSAQQVA